MPDIGTRHHEAPPMELVKYIWKNDYELAYREWNEWLDWEEELKAKGEWE